MFGFACQFCKYVQPNVLKEIDTKIYVQPNVLKEITKLFKFASISISQNIYVGA